MDSLTQIVIGIATAEAFIGKEVKNRTFLYGAIIATVPDLDVLVGKFLNPVTAISIHRSFSHSIIFYLLISPLLGAIMFRIEKGKIKLFKTITTCFFILLTHSILDLFTTWGTQFFWPLPYRLALKSIFVVDFFYTIPWLVCLYFVFKNSDFYIRKKWLTIGFVISSMYLIYGLGIKTFVVKQFETALKNQNIIYSKIIVKPTFSNIILWNANVMTQDAVLLSDYSLLDTKPISFTSYNRNLDLAKSLKEDPTYKELEEISEGWYILQNKNDTIFFNDLRYGILKNNAQDPKFAFSYSLVVKNDKLLVNEQLKEKREGKDYLLKIFKRILKKN
jgi:inner membrane protein